MSDGSIGRLLTVRGDKQADSEAILAPGRLPLTYGRLKEHVAHCVARLNALGIGRGDRVAIVLPNGPEMAVAFLSVGAGATCAPLNPSYRAPEFEFYLTDLQPKALIFQPGMDSVADQAAESLGIPVISLSPIADGPAGLFDLSGPVQPLTAAPGLAEPGDLALLLHTSGTLSRPKLVPLTHRNLCASAGNIRGTLELTPADRCLNVMPLFHIHGLAGAILATLAGGASVVCTPGFYAPQFFGWVAEHRPTWYTAVPSMYQAVLGRASQNRDVIARSPLRFIRSASSPLPPRLMAEMESAFGAPVIEAYGMTEASNQITSNPLPPRPRKPGSVGLPAGSEVAIMAEGGAGLLPTGERGEIVIRGANVTSGYLQNPEANAKAFTDGWFRTGDQGYMDGDGYLRLVGRLKEIINRGGEKVSPREVDEALLDHPDVAQAVAFAMPNAALGEEVAAAVVLHRPGTTEKELRRFAAQRLADFKVPRRIVILDEIPKGATGKLQRIGLAAKLGLSTPPEAPAEGAGPFVAPRNAVEKALAALWCEVLKVPKVGVTQRFLELGGDSVLAGLLVARIRQRLDLNVSLADFLDAPTVADQAGVLTSLLVRRFGDAHTGGSTPPGRHNAEGAGA